MIEELLQKLDKVQDDLKKGGRHTFKRANVVRELECDTDKLYGPLDKAIAYLQDIYKKQPKAELEEKWTGYEDMYMRFAWGEPETDEEYVNRLECALRTEEYLRKQRDERQRKDVIRKQIAELQKKL